MTDLKTAIREYITVADRLLQQGVRYGLLSIEDAKQDAAEIEKWQEKLAMLEGRPLQGELEV
jgi:hypothetical protein